VISTLLLMVFVAALAGAAFALIYFSVMLAVCAWYLIGRKNRNEDQSDIYI